jgi:hypothetical protein
MKNCLKTKLKDVVNNDSLSKLGELPIIITDASNNSVTLVRTNNQPVSLRAGDGVTITQTAGSLDVTFTGTGYAFLENKYDFRKADCNHKIAFDYADLKTCDIGILSIYPGGVLNGKELSLYSVFKSMGSLNLSTTEITGDIVELADAAVAGDNPRTTGTLDIRCNGSITLNGSIISSGTHKWVKYGENLPSGAEYTGTGYAIYSSNPG